LRCTTKYSYNPATRINFQISYEDDVEQILQAFTHISNPFVYGSVRFVYPFSGDLKYASSSA
jgi:hypothetical protein